MSSSPPPLPRPSRPHARPSPRHTGQKARAFSPRLLQLILFFGAIIVAATLPAVTAKANGASTVRLQDTVVGPYMVTVSTAPAQLNPGTFRVSTLVRDAASREPVPDVQVVIWAQPPQQFEQNGPYNAVLNTATPPHFDVDIPVDRIGEWRLLLTVSGDLGEDGVFIPVEVINPGTSLTVIIAIVTGVLLLVLLGIAYRVIDKRSTLESPD